jgi:hypothetical protein
MPRLSDSVRGPRPRNAPTRTVTPYVPASCYAAGPRVCPCGHHEGYHSDAGVCLLTAACQCVGLPAACRTPMEDGW